MENPLVSAHKDDPIGSGRNNILDPARKLRKIVCRIDHEYLRTLGFQVFLKGKGKERNFCQRFENIFRPSGGYRKDKTGKGRS